MRAGLLLLLALAVAGVPGVRSDVRIAELYGAATGADVSAHLDQILVIAPLDGPDLNDMAEELTSHPAVGRAYAPKVPADIAKDLDADQHKRVLDTLRGGESWQTLLLDVGPDRRDLVRELRTRDVQLVGAPVAEEAYGRAAITELARITLPTFAVFAGCLWWLFRGVGGVVLPLSAAASNGLVMLGIIGWSHQSIAGPNTLLIPLVVVLSLADSVHLVRQIAAEDAKVGDAVARALRVVGPACFLTSLTTALGFLTLAATSQPLLQRFGLLAAAGMGVAWVVSLGVPAMLVRQWPSLVPAPPTRRPVVSAPRGLTTALVALLLATAWLGAQVQTGLRPLGSLPDPHPLRTAGDIVDRDLGGSQPLVLHLQGKELSRDVETYDRLVTLRTRLAADPVVGTVWSFADAAAWVGASMGRPPEMLAGTPRQPPMMRQRRFGPVYKATSDLAARVSPIPLIDGDTYVLSARLRGQDVAAWSKTVQTAEDLGASASGHVALAVGAWRQVWPDFLHAVGLAGGVTLLGVGLRFGPRLALLTALALGVAVTTPLAAITLLDGRLDPPGVVVFTLGIGVGVDGILHMAHRLRHDSASWAEVARPVLWSQGLTLAGLATLAWVSSLPMLREIAALLAVSSTVGVAASVWLAQVWLTNRS